jgi:ABC-type sulfate/molybdate transport systems ATPase subunit
VTLVVAASVRVPPFALDARFEARPGVTVLHGPTASGKTLTLRLVAGLERAATGSVRLNNVTVDGDAFVRANARGIGYAPQHGSLWPHMTAREHLTAFTTDREASTLLTTVGLEALSTRKPSHLSGGERQRLAFARAIARGSSVLLLDEPFSALHDDARVAMGDMVRARAKQGATILFVTHDRAEALRLADAFVAVRDGRAVAAETI